MSNARRKATTTAQETFCTASTSAFLDDPNEQALRGFLTLQRDEDPFLDYKSSLYDGSSSDAAHREFLKDVTGFANAYGGDIIIGVTEPGKVGSLTRRS